MKTYINAQKPKMIFEVIHHVMVATKIFTPNKGIMKIPKNKEKNSSKDCAHKDNKNTNSKDQRPNDNKKKDSKEYKGQNKLSLKDLEKYQKENQCYRCGEQGHSYCNCPNKKILKELHKKLTYYPTKTRMCQALLNVVTLGG